MAITHIPVNPAAAGAIYVTELESAQRDLRRAWDKIKALKEKFDHNVDGGSDYTAVGTKCGASTSDGQTIYNLTAGTVSALGGSDVQAFMSRVGKG
jgi:hypothetical protein